MCLFARRQNNEKLAIILTILLVMPPMALAVGKYSLVKSIYLATIYSFETQNLIKHIHWQS
jgi:hypothetical protein